MKFISGVKINEYCLPGSKHKLSESIEIGKVRLIEKQHLALAEKALTNTELLSLFTGLTTEYLQKHSIQGLESAIVSWSFLKTPAKYPNKIASIGKYNLPLNSKGEFNIQFESLAQFEDMKAVMFKTPDNNAYEYAKALGKYCAIYVQKIRDGFYSLDKAISMEDEIMDMPAFEVIVLGNFFFIKLLSLMSGIMNASQATKQTPTKKKPVSRNSKKRSGRSAR